MEGNIFINGLIGTILNADGEVQEKGVELVDVITQVNSQKSATSFNVYINSEGGVVSTGFDIYNYLKTLSVPVNTIGQGLVASIATVIFMAGQRRILKPNTEFMIHLPSGGVEGTSDDIQEYAGYIKQVEKDIVKFYKESTGLSEDAIIPLLRNETFLDTKQAFELGFSNTQPIAVEPVAYFNTNTNKQMTELSKQDKSWIETKFDAILNAFKSKPTMLVIQDANGTEIDFPTLEEGQDVVVGLEAKINGQPAEGEFVIPTGQTYVFAGGVLSEIKEGEQEEVSEEMKALLAELEQMTKKFADESTARETAEKEATEQKEIVAKLQKEVKEFKAQITSKFDLDGKKEKKEVAEELSPAKKALLKLKNK